MTLEEARRIDVLSPRQREILRLLGRRLQQKEVARRLGISPWTVRDHVIEAREKLQVETTREAILMMMDYEAAYPPPAQGPLPQGIAGIEEIAPLPGHEQAISSPPKPIPDAPDSSMGGSAGSIERTGRPDAPRGHRGRIGSVQGAADVDGSKPSDHDRVGDSLADRRERAGARQPWLRRLQVFEQSLKHAGPARLVAVTGICLVVGVFTVGVVVVGIVGTLESLNAFFHPVR